VSPAQGAGLGRARRVRWVMTSRSERDRLRTRCPVLLRDRGAHRARARFSVLRKAVLLAEMTEHAGHETRPCPRPWRGHHATAAPRAGRPRTAPRYPIPCPASRLATNLRELGEYQQARALDQDTLARRRRVLGDDHPDTRIAAHNLAGDLRVLGEPEETETHLPRSPSPSAAAGVVPPASDERCVQSGSLGRGQNPSATLRDVRVNERPVDGLFAGDCLTPSQTVIARTL
jgi:hypothetical protein